MRKIKGIAIHCTAGFAGIENIERFWRKARKDGGAGWMKSKGYNIIVDLNGVLWYLVDPLIHTGGYSLEPNKETYNFITNGVLGFNNGLINISYIGGIDRNNKNKPLDTRSEVQKAGLKKAINRALAYIHNHGQDVRGIKISGHRDFSPDKNGNGVVDPWERIKECPCFDAIPEYNGLISNFVAHL